MLDIGQFVLGALGPQITALIRDFLGWHLESKGTTHWQPVALEAAMRHRYLRTAPTPSVKAARGQLSSIVRCARPNGSLGSADPVVHDRLTEQEDALVAGRDSIYVASVSGTEWPGVSFRGHPGDFLCVLSGRMLGYAHLRSNRLHITTSNMARNDRVSLFLMDYAHRQWLKILGRISVTDARDDPSLATTLAMANSPERAERNVLITVENFDWNWPGHITPRFTQDEPVEALAPAREEIKALLTENERLKRLLNADVHERTDP